MKISKITLGLLASIMVVGCNKADESEFLNSENLKTVSVALTSADSTKVSVSANSTKWVTEWEEGDSIGAWSENTGLFCMNMVSMEAPTAAVFSGQIDKNIDFDETNARYIYPYKKDCVVDNKLTIDLSNQVSDSNAPDSQLGDFSYMINEKGVKKMSSLTAMIEIKFTISAWIPAPFYLQKVVLIGSMLSKKGEYDLTSETLETTPLEPGVDSIVVNVENPLNLDKNKGNAAIVRFAALPFTVKAGEKLTVKGYFNCTSGFSSSAYKGGQYLEYVIEPETDLVFNAGTYNTFSRNAADNYQKNWKPYTIE